MNYYDARKLADGSGWHFTRRNDDLISAVGYCREHEPHDTPEDARECFRQWLLDDVQEENYGDWTGCEAEVMPGKKCDTPTKKGLTGRRPLGSGFALCDEHRTPEQLADLTPSVGRITASY